MNITLNGEPAQTEAGWSIAQLVASLGLVAGQVAVEVNGAIVPKSTHATASLSEGDTIEIVRFIGGG